MNDRNKVIDHLRGFAAVIVCVCHYRDALPEPIQNAAKMFGELGVQIFFVISGFIIPFSMHRGGYRLADIGRFWQKRLLRLQPTLWASLLVAFALAHAAGFAHGSAAHFKAWTLLKSAFYLSIPAANPVLWTLIVEVKYYLLIGLTFPLFFSARSLLRRTAFFAAVLGVFFGAASLPDLSHLPYFLMGFACCQVATRRSGSFEFVLLLSVAAAVALAGSTPLQLAAGLLTCIAILHLPPTPTKLGDFFGAISYSLYLVHFPVGVKFLNLMLPRFAATWHPLIGAVAFGLSTGLAYAIYRLVEKPSSEWSQRIRLSPAAIRSPALKKLAEVPAPLLP
jgi:peptidoglycan/LPS O-acetylase OafA/YrhL